MLNLSCPYCSSNHCQVDYDLTWKDDRFPEYQVASCNQCGVGFVLPLPTQGELDVLYNSIEYHAEDRSTVDFWKTSGKELAARIESDNQFIDRYQKYIPDSGSVLDIGAGWGTLLKAFANKGYKTVGLELSEPTSRFARERLELEIFNFPVERIGELPYQSFDLITMRHVLEHFYDPRVVLSNVSNRLEVGGKLIVEVPDYGSFDRKIYGTEWPAFGPYHLWYFSRMSLTRVLKDQGFAITNFKNYLSERVFGGNNLISKFGRRLMNRVGAKRIFSGRSIGLIATKITETNRE